MLDDLDRSNHEFFPLPGIEQTLVILYKEDLSLHNNITVDGVKHNQYLWSMHIFHLVCLLCSFYFLPTTATMSGIQRTTQPIVTGTSVVGLKYDGGVLLAADTLLSYGSMAKSFNTPRLHAIDNKILLGASGEYSDFQEIVARVEALALEETTMSMESLYEPQGLSAQSLWNYLRAVMYQKRSKFNPFWNDLVVAGFENETPFLGVVDKLGTTLQENMIATGFGAYLAMPLLREKWRPDLSEGEARALLEDCMKVLFYRDCRASARIQLAKVTDQGCVISEPYNLDHSNGWNAPSMIRAVGDLDGDGGW